MTTYIHKFIDGVPKFHHRDPILESCSTFIRAKQTRKSAGPNSTLSATHPIQCLSIEFSFSGTHFKNTLHKKDYERLCGETSWILIADHFTNHLTKDTRRSKVSPGHWLSNFLDIHAPGCPDKYLYMDQGGKLFHNSKIRTLFIQKGCKIQPAGANASHQNIPVKQSHRTIAS